MKKIKPSKLFTEDDQRLLTALESSWENRRRELNDLYQQGVKWQHALIKREELFRIGRQISKLKHKRGH